MGWFGTTLGLLGGVAKASATASMCTGNMLYTALQNAHTKKEIMALCRDASNANYQNRAVALIPGVNKQQLLLTTSDPDDDDILEYTGKSQTMALDFIWGENDDPDSVIVSGGYNKQRVCALIPFVHKAQTKDIPVIAIHENNTELQAMMQKHCTCYEFISRSECYYDVFRGMPADDIAFLLYETMSENEASPAAESLLHALIEVILRTEGTINLYNLAKFPIINLKNTIDTMNNNGMFTDEEYDEISHFFMAGSSETDAVRIFLNRLSRQADAVYGKPLSRMSNTKKMLNLRGVIAIDVGNSSNNLIVSLVVNFLLMLQSQGKEFVVLLDELPISRHEKIRDLIYGHTFAISSPDFVASLFGGEQHGDDLFSEITGNVSTTVLFKHGSGTSCKKWSDHFGTYRKIRIKYNISQNNAFMNSNNSKGVSVDETDEPRIRADTISKLEGNLACIYNSSGILIAKVEDI